MPTQAIPLALIASVYPIGLAALLLLFQTSRPKARSLAFLAGALVCTLSVGFAVVFVLRGAGLHHSDQQTPKYALRLSIGALLLVVSWFLHRTKPRAPQHQPSRITTTINNSGLVAVFLLGVALYTPSPAYLTALQTVGTTRLDTATTVAWVFIVVVLLLISLWVPLLIFFVAPAWTTAKLAAADAWLRRKGRHLMVVVLVTLGGVDGDRRPGRPSFLRAGQLRARSPRQALISRQMTG